MYRLDLEQWAVAQEVLEYHRLKREPQAPSAVEVVSSAVATEGDFHRNINKGGSVTTTVVDESMTPEDLAETSDILVQAAAAQERDLVQAVWNVVSLEQRSLLLQTMTQEVRQQVLSCLIWNPERVDRSQGCIEVETRIAREAAA